LNYTRMIEDLIVKFRSEFNSDFTKNNIP